MGHNKSPGIGVQRSRRHSGRASCGEAMLATVRKHLRNGKGNRFCRRKAAAQDGDFRSGTASKAGSKDGNFWAGFHQCA